MPNIIKLYQLRCPFRQNGLEKTLTLRRRFFELHANGESVVASATVEQMKLLWAVENEARGQSAVVPVTFNSAYVSSPTVQLHARARDLT